MKRISRTLALAGLLVVTSLPAMSGIAQAAGTVTITGKTPANYTVLMVGKNGNSTAVKGGKFKLKVSASTAKGASLHLVSSNGTYSGPVVLKYDKKKKSGNTLLSGKSGDVGSIAMKTGYSIAAAKKTTAISTSAKIPVSTSGKPSGAGRMGIPTSTQAKAVRTFGVSKWADGDAPNGADTDKDGLPNTLDIDDDDDGKIDLVDDSNPSKAITTGSLLFLDISKTINLHAGMDETSMQAAIDSIFKSNNNFWIGLGLNTGSQEAPDGIHISCAADVLWCASSSPAITAALTASSASMSAAALATSIAVFPLASSSTFEPYRIAIQHFPLSLTNHQALNVVQLHDALTVPSTTLKSDRKNRGLPLVGPFVVPCETVCKKWGSVFNEPAAVPGGSETSRNTGRDRSCGRGRCRNGR